MNCLICDTTNTSRIYTIIWSDVYNKSGNILLETQIMVADLTAKVITTTKTKRNTTEPKRKRGKQQFTNNHRWKSIWQDNTIKKTNIIYSLTLYHTRNTILIQGSRKSIWVTKELPLMKAIINHKCKHNAPITDVYNQILEMENETTIPNKVQQKDDPTSKTPEPDQTNQDHNNSLNNLITPSNITNDKYQIAQNQQKPTSNSSIFS